MALMSFIAKNVKRSAGKSIIGAVAYRAGIIMVNAQGEVFDFSRRKMSIVHTEIFLPASAPDWAHDRNKLWNRADAAERRAKAVTGREFILNLPHELDDNQRLDLVARFAREIVQRHGCAVDAAVHRPSKKGDQRNHHVHMMLSTRRLDAIGFGEKTRELDTKKDPALEKCRETWAQFVNDALAAAGHDARIDHRSYKKQGIDKLPQWHLGSKNADLERQGIRTLAGDHNRVIAKINAMKSAPALSWTFAGWTRQEELAQQAADIREIAAQRAQRAADKAQQQEIQRAADAEEAAENAILAKREREVMESQAKAAEIAVIADLRQKYDGLEDRYITAWESLDSKLDALHTAKNKIDHDEAEDRAGRSTSTYVRYYPTERSNLEEAHQPKLDAARVEVAKVAKEWAVCRAELEQVGHSFEPPARKLWGKLTGKQSPEEISEANYAHAVEKITEFEPAGKRHEAREQQERNRQFVERQRIADEPERRAREAAEAELRHQENLRIRAERVAAREAKQSSSELDKPRPDDDSPSLG